MPGERRLAAIMFTDMVGYTALMERDEGRARLLVERSRSHIRALVERFHGQSLEATGDATLSAFPSAVEAVDCALAIQESLRSDPNLTLRIGIHLGDVVFADEGIYGDGVNVASRIEPLAPPGGVAVSESVSTAIRGRVGVHGTYLGKKRLKNVTGPVRVYSLATGAEASRRRGPDRSALIRRMLIAIFVLLAIGTVGWLYERAPPGSHDRPAGSAESEHASIAVLPFVNLSEEAGREYFSNGLTEELIGMLSGVEKLRVVSRRSSFALKDTTADAREIGRMLGVQSLLEGSVRVDGDRIRVTAQLTSAETGFHYWSETYERQLTGVFEIQEDLARRITAALEVHLNSSDEKRIGEVPTGNLEAYALSLQGRYFMDPRNEKGILQAIEYYRKALELDPGYARAHAWLADAHLMLGTWGLTETPNDSIGQARKIALQALELDPSLAEAHATLGFVEYWHDWDWESAERRFLRAIELQPSYSTAHHWYALMLTDAGRFQEAEREIRLARNLDPLSLIIRTISGRLYYFEGRHDEAVAEHLQALELDPDYAIGHMWLALAYEARGDVQQALRHYRRATEIDSGSAVLQAGLARGLAVSGDESASREILNELENSIPGKYEPPFWIAVVHMSLGDFDRAFIALERGLAERDGWMNLLKHGPFVEPLRADPRFARFRTEVGSPWRDHP